MTKLTTIVFFLLITRTLFGQELSNSRYGMTHEENKLWLNKVAKAAKETQLTLIQDKFFRQKEFKKAEMDDVPLIIANGIVVDEFTHIALKMHSPTNLHQTKLKLP